MHMKLRPIKTSLRLLKIINKLIYEALFITFCNKNTVYLGISTLSKQLVFT